MQDDHQKADCQLRPRLLRDGPVVRRNRYFPMFGWPLDQGMTGTCCGFAGKHWGLSAPVIQHRRLGPPTGIDLYLAATKRDPWHGGQRDTSLQDGTSLTALMLALRDEFGHIAEFLWTNEVDDIIDYMSRDDGGPVILGLPWGRSMMRTDQEGIVRVNRAEDFIGGHAICANRLNWKQGRIEGPNSWGRPADFGKLNPATGLSDGRFRFDLDDLRWLMERSGDAVIARERRAA